ncbi:MAG: tetratricopeptide repeat protein [Anaerolineae bacterium]|nr:tetratricopeptide repeat protein [Anaerolineae bacterium]MDQ7034709.1 tetratricopeptide repeat protein [Anaerolineae bacterium]
MRNNILIGVGLIIVLSVAVFAALSMQKRIDNLERELEQRTELVNRGDVIEQATEILNQAQGAVDLAVNLLGLFEALSLAVTVGGVVLVAMGLGNFNDARTQLAETREEVSQEAENYRAEFEKYRQTVDEEIKKREEELKKLRHELEESAKNDRQTTANALLANALIPLGERQYKASDYTGAMNTYRRALELDSINPVVNQRLAYVHTAMGNLEAAKEHYQKAIETEPNFAPALAGLGFVTRRFAEQLEKEINGDDLSHEVATQKRLEHDQLLTEAAGYLQHALQISPKLIDDDGESWWGVLGGLRKRRGQIKQAIEAYRQATIVTPQSSYGYGNLAQLYMKEGDVEKMLETFERVEQIAFKEADATEGNFWGYSDLVVSSYAIGKHEQARRCLPIAISIAPVDSPYMLEGLVETLREVVEHVQDEKKPHIYEAIEILDVEMAERDARMNKPESAATEDTES